MYGMLEDMIQRLYDDCQIINDDLDRVIIVDPVPARVVARRVLPFHLDWGNFLATWAP